VWEMWEIWVWESMTAGPRTGPPQPRPYAAPSLLLLRLLSSNPALAPHACRSICTGHTEGHACAEISSLFLSLSVSVSVSLLSALCSLLSLSHARLRTRIRLTECGSRIERTKTTERTELWTSCWNCVRKILSTSVRKENTPSKKRI
jgi:hypothetical protein